MKLRTPCMCGSTVGLINRKGFQDCVYCGECSRFQYNAPRTETGEREVSTTTVHKSIRPKQRARILLRASTRCELCGSREYLQVGHIISVSAGLQFGIDQSLLNDDENLVALCAQCNTGIGPEPMPLRIAVAVLRARVAWRDHHE